jgi:hypothetical protein
MMIDKSHRIQYVVKYLQDKYGKENILIKDYWQADFDAIGLTNNSGQRLAYVSTVSDKDDDYHLALENPPINNDFPYSPAGEFDNLSLTELERLLTKHLGLTVD